MSDMIRSDADALAVASGFRVTTREHRYRGGPPPLRLRRLQAWYEVRARQLGVPYDLIDLRDVYAKTQGVCGICQQPIPENEFTVSYILPLSSGGTHLLENLQPAHPSCKRIHRRR